MSGYVIGVDTGSTKSRLALFDREGNLVRLEKWGPLSFEEGGTPGSYALFEEEFGRFVGGALSKSGITIKDVAYSVLGLTGIDTKPQHRVVSGILQNLGFRRFTLVNDAFLGIPIGNPEGVGICAINGTGCTLAGINRQGKMLQIGGVGYVSADYGGGGIMGRLVVSTVYSELFRRGEPTRMTPALFRVLGISDKHDFVEKVYEKLGDRSLNVCALSSLLFNAVRENDQTAAKLLRGIGESYAGGIACMIDELQLLSNETLYVVFAGSNFTKGEHPLLIDTIKETVGGYFPDYRIAYVLPEAPPVAGAVIWAFNVLNGNAKGALHDKICFTLKKADNPEN